MSSSKENNLVQAYIELSKFCQNGDYQKALKAANKVLQIDPSEQKAFHCKVICYIHLNDFKEVLQLLSNPKHKNYAAPLLFEKAYAQYRLNLTKEALQTVDTASESTPAIKELRAQILYRLEKYDECYNQYRDIVKTSSDDYEDERKANIAAVIGKIAALNPSADLPELEETTYELSYNRASAVAMRGNFSEAMPILKRAEQRCVETLIEDGSTDEEAKEESAIIRVQQAYCLQMLGREKEAGAIYQAILKEKPNDQALLAIASNNLVVLNRESNVFDSRKRMKAATADGLEHKLNTRQRAAIFYNQAILAIYSNQPEFCKQCCVKLCKEFNMEAKAALVEASSLVKEGKHKQALDVLNKFGDELKLAALQILLSQGNRKEAINLLENSKLKFAPGIIGLMVTILCADNEIDKAIQLFNQALEHYKNDKSESLYALWRGAAALGARAGRDGDALATRALEAAYKSRPGDARSLARLVRALALTDTQRARQLSTQLPRIANLEGNIDVESLENSKWIMGAKVVKKATGKPDQSPGTPATDPTKKKAQNKRKRKTKLPPNADLSKPPDPERWLPKYERSAYRKRRAVGRGPVRGPQGLAGAAASDQFDMSKQQPSSAAAAAKSPRVEQKSESGAWQRKQQQKKKGKGRRN